LVVVVAVSLSSPCYLFPHQAGGGIGGGGMLVPIYILVLQFSPRHAIPLSNITVFGGAVANTLLNVQKRHPLADRPLVDWDLILVMEPLSTFVSWFGRWCACVVCVFAWAWWDLRACPVGCLRCWLRAFVYS
jgi:hypothetical protein